MQTLQQGRRRNAAAGEPIHCPFRVFTDNKMFIRRGQLTLISGGPGTGKSALTQAWLQRGDDRGNRNTVLYFSADSDAGTMFKRSVAIAKGWTQDDIERWMKEGHTSELEVVSQEAGKHMRWDFTTSPSEQDVLDAVQNYRDAWGAYPEVIVMDNLKNLFVGIDGEFEALEQATMFLQGLSKDTGSAVIALHHVLGEHENGMSPIPLTGVRGKVSKTPEVVLTLHRAGGYLNVSVVKNRNGRADTSGRYMLPLTADMERIKYEG